MIKNKKPPLRIEVNKPIFKIRKTNEIAIKPNKLELTGVNKDFKYKRKNPKTIEITLTPINPSAATPSVAQKFAFALFSESKKNELTTNPNSCLNGYPFVNILTKLRCE